MVICQGINASSYSGYQVVLFQEVVSRLNWTSDMFYYRCLDWTVMINDLVSPTGTCFMAPAGVDVTLANYALGVQFTWPTYKQGLSILVASKVFQGDVFDVFKVFDWSVWSAMVLTGVAVGLVLWLTERFGAGLHFFAPKQDLDLMFADHGIDLRGGGGGGGGGRWEGGGGMAGPDLSGPSVMSIASLAAPSCTQHTHPALGAPPKTRSTQLARSLKQAAQHASRLQTAGVGAMVWYSFARLVNMGTPDPITWGGRIVMMAYGFLLLIMINFWTANTAALVTTSRLSSTITSRGDLVGKAVGTWGPYVASLTKYGIAAAAFPWENKSDERAMLNALSSGMVKALVLDSSFVKYSASTNCSFHVVGDDFNSWQLSWAFPPETPASDIDVFTTELINLQMSLNIMDTLEDQFINRIDNSSCPIVVAGSDDQVTFRQVAGLWIILGGAVALCLSSLALVWFLRKRKLGKRFVRSTALRSRSKVVRRGSVLVPSLSAPLDFGDRLSSLPADLLGSLIPPERPSCDAGSLEGAPSSMHMAAPDGAQGPGGEVGGGTGGKAGSGVAVGLVDADGEWKDGIGSTEVSGTVRAGA